MNQYEDRYENYFGGRGDQAEDDEDYYRQPGVLGPPASQSRWSFKEIDPPRTNNMTVCITLAGTIPIAVPTV